MKSGQKAVAPEEKILVKFVCCQVPSFNEEMPLPACKWKCITLRKFSMSVALPVIPVLHFGQTSCSRFDLNFILKYLTLHLSRVRLLASFTDVVAIATLEDPGGKHHLIKANL